MTAFLSGNTRFYLSPDGSDTYSDVLASNGPTNIACPGRTLSYLWSSLMTQINANGVVVTIDLHSAATGNPVVYDRGVQMTGNIPGILTPDHLVWRGKTGDKSAVVIRLTQSDYCFSVAYGAMASVYDLTLDGLNDNSYSIGDRIVIGQSSEMKIGNLHFKGCPDTLNNGAKNDISHYLLGKLVIGGDLTFSRGYRQCGIYSSDNAVCYANINNIPSANTFIPANILGSYQSGTNIVTLNTAIPNVGEYGPGYAIVRGAGIPENSIVKTIDSTRKIVTLMDRDGNDVQIGSTQIDTPITYGGLFFHFVNDGVKPSFLAALWGTSGAQLNLQGMEGAGSFTGTSYLLKQGARIDVGRTTASALFPGSLPGIADGATGSVAMTDGVPVRLSLARTPNPSPFSGTTLDGVISFIEYDNNKQLLEDADGKYFVSGDGRHLFFCDGGEISLVAMTPYISSGGLGVGTHSPDVGSGSYGVHVRSPTSNKIATLRMENSVDGTDIRLIANAPDYTQLVSTHRFLVAVGGQNWLQVSTTGEVSLLSGATLTLASDPTTAMQAATKQYVDNAIAALVAKSSRGVS